MKSIKYFLCFIIISLFIMPNVYASSLKVNEITVKDKSGTISIEDLELDDDGTITSNITFNQIHDFVTFDIEIENNYNTPYALESITNNEDDYLTVEYEYGKIIQPGTKEHFNITLKYSEELINVEEVRYNDLRLNLIFSNDEKLINPQTSNPMKFFIKILFVLGMLFVGFKFLKKKHIKLFVLLILLIPFLTKAEEGNTLTINFSDIKVKGRFLQYEIVIDLGNGEYQTVNETYGTTIEELPEPEKRGYSFTKWVDQDNEEVSTDTIITGDMQLTPVYEPIQYTITYNLAGGTVSASNPVTYNIETDSFTLNNPTKPGYTFSGWRDEESGEVQTSVTVFRGTINDKSYTATFSVNTNTPYTVIHKQQNLNNNDYTTYETQNLTGATDSQVTPQRRSYTGFTAPAGQTVTINGNGTTTVTYLYTRNTYTFSVSDRTYVTGTSNGTYKYGYSISVTAQSRAGYTFKWSDNTTLYTKSFTISSSTTLSAVYTARTDTAYTVIHQQQNIDNNNYTTVATNTYYGTTGASVTPSVNSYTGFTSPSAQTKTINGDGSTTITYQYNRISYTLTLTDSNYITTTTPSGSYRYGKSITLTANSNSPYSFIKWSDDTTTSTYTFTLTGNKTIGPLYGSVVTLNANGGTINPATISVLSGESIGTIPTPTPSSSSRTFIGWYTTPSEGGSEVTSSYTPTGNIEIFARWEYHPEATFDTGKNVNKKMKKIAGNSNATYESYDSTTEEIKFANSLPSDFTATTNNTVSIANSDEPIYIWYDSTNKYIYYYTDAEKIYLNSDASYMFNNFYMVHTIEKTNDWDTSRVTNMYYLFCGVGTDATTLSIDVTSWKTSNVTNMLGTFCIVGENVTGTWSIGDLSNWDTSNVTNMERMFFFSGSKTASWDIGNIGSWNVSKVTNMERMFMCAGQKATNWNLGDLSSWKPTKASNLYGTFYGACGKDTDCSLGTFKNWNLSSATNISSMLSGYASSVANFNLDLSGLQIPNVTNMNSIINGAGASATEWHLNITNMNASKLTNMSYLFSNIGNNVVDEDKFSIEGLSTLNISKVTDMSYMFYNSLQKIEDYSFDEIEQLNVSNVTNLNSFFSNSFYRVANIDLDLTNWNVSKVTSFSGLFSYFGNYSSSVEIDITGWNMENATITSYMFSNTGYNASKLKLYGISNLNVSNVTDFSGMFQSVGYNATDWNIGDLSNWNVSKATSMSEMFFCSGYKATTWNIGDLSNWDTKKVTNMSSMFRAAGGEATNWVSIGTINVYATDLGAFFSSCPKAKATMNIYRKPTNYTTYYANNPRCFNGAATDSSALITVNYTSAVDNIDDVLATKSSNSNVVKGSLITTS